jgi:histidine triad (HIT) family protein
VLYQDDLVTAFWDAHPASSTHILIVPNRHIPSLNEFSEQDELLSGRLFLVASQIARQENIHRRGYSLTVNTGLHAGQTVFHLHIHLKSLGD